MSAALDERLARAFGVELDTSVWLPGEDAEPEALLRAAEHIGLAIGDRRAPTRPIAWAALPMRDHPPRSPEERREAIAGVLAWATAAGASWNGIEVRVDVDGNAAVRAARALSPGETILTLPRHLMIVDDKLGAATTGLAPRDALAAWLPIEAREPTSQWRAYLETLPVQLAELPMFHDDLSALAGTTAYALAAEDNRDVIAAYEALAAELRTRVSLADFAWGCAVVQSRGFHAPGTIEHRIALMPVVDLFNHRLGDTTWTFDPLDGNFVLATERAFAAGDEVHFTYGDHGNTQLLVHYGFAEAGNTASEAGLLFDVPSDPVTAVAAELLWNVPLDAPARMRVGCILDHRFLRALSLARLHAAGPAERARALASGLAAHGDMPWLDGVHEEAAFAVIAAGARRALAELAALPAGSSAWEQQCSDVRAGERAVLAHIIEVAGSVVPHLHATDPAAVRAAAEAATGLLRQYLTALADALA